MLGVSSHSVFELNGFNCIENSTPKPRGIGFGSIQLEFELTGARFTEVIVQSFPDANVK